MDLYPIVSVMTGAAVAATNHHANAVNLANAINKAAGHPVVAVGGPIPGNPGYAKDPAMLARLVSAARATIRRVL